MRLFRFTDFFKGLHEKANSGSDKQKTIKGKIIIIAVLCVVCIAAVSVTLFFTLGGNAEIKYSYSGEINNPYAGAIIDEPWPVFKVAQNMF